MEKKNVLVYPCGTDEGLELNKALAQMTHYRLFGLGKDSVDRGEFIFENYLGFLSPEQPDFAEQLSNIIDWYNIDYIYPASFDVLLSLSSIGEFGCAEVIAPSLKTSMICKSRESLVKNMQNKVAIIDPKRYPPDSQHKAICFTNRQGELLFVNSIQDCSDIIGTSVLNKYQRQCVVETAHIINDQLDLIGAWTFRFVLLPNDNWLGVVEVVPGFSAVMSISRQKGINLATLSLLDRMGHTIEILDNGIEVEVTTLQTQRWRIDYEYDDVYVDLDDTILVKNQVNPLVIAFLYQCRNQTKKIHLITKHRYKLEETLEKFKLKGIFDSVIWLKSHERKSHFIKSERSIFIDDAFSERREVSESLGIPTFEVSAVESLFDWRM